MSVSVLFVNLCFHLSRLRATHCIFSNDLSGNLVLNVNVTGNTVLLCLCFFCIEVGIVTTEPVGI